jgi:hypothetical protein
VTYKRKKHLPTIRKIADELWDEIRLILPPGKPDKTIGRPVVPFRKVLDGILYVLRTGCQWKMLLPKKEYDNNSRFRYAEEVRHQSWFQDLSYNFFPNNNIYMVWSQPAAIRTLPIVTSDFLYIRFIGDRTSIQEKRGSITPSIRHFYYQL